jgi:hypothetical protein
MEWELVKIEGRENPKALGRHWFTVSECAGRAGCLTRAVGFALTNQLSQFALPLSYALIADKLIAKGLKQGQRAIIRFTRTYPAGEKVYYRFTAR